MAKKEIQFPPSERSRQERKREREAIRNFVAEQQRLERGYPRSVAFTQVATATGRPLYTDELDTFVGEHQRRPKPITHERHCRWKGCGKRLALFNDGSVRSPHKDIKKAPDGAPLDLCFGHRAEANAKRNEFRTEKDFSVWLKEHLTPARGDAQRAAS